MLAGQTEEVVEILFTMNENRSVTLTASNYTSVTSDLVTSTSALPPYNTTDELHAILYELSQERALYNIPAMIFVCLLMFLGVVGNSLVVYVYSSRFKKTSSNYFILTMAVFDLIACAIGMPTEIYDLNNPYTFYSVAGCKILRGCEVFNVYGSAIVLVEIAFDRYFKICRPLMMVNLSRIRVQCGLAVVLAAAMSVSAFFLFGIDRNHTPIPGVYGFDCSISETYKSSTFQLVYYFVLGALFLITLVVLIGLYIRIWLEIRCRRRLVNGEQIPREKDTDSKKRIRIKYLPSMSEDESLNNAVSHHGNNISMMELQKSSGKSVTTQTSVDRRSKLQSLARYASRLKVTRTTVVLFAVTVAFVLSYLPSTAVMVVRSTVKDFDKNQSAATQIFIKIFSNCMFINNAINPIIYSFFNIHFRRQVTKTVQRVFCCFPRRRHPPQKVDSDRSTKKEFLPSD
ncbi:D(3) dopamine receptor-like [Physella acuta]|uniref:D(3) dopamine receptor-like n=1 Tax=Physella acuta TaxID=109671 RepID=UPI0027DB9E6D|nr:D(3) dopamine receptor-like [Physella acuta]